MKLLRAFCNFWWDFLIGDDWKIAVYVVVSLGVVVAVVASGVVPDAVAVAAGTLLVAACFAAGVAYDARRLTRRP